MASGLSSDTPLTDAVIEKPEIPATGHDSLLLAPLLCLKMLK
jgi:hypothetical protein